MIKIAMIGTSAIADKFANASKYDKRCELEIIYSRTLNKAKEFQTRHQINRATDQMKELFKSNVDFIYIATPNKIHYEQVKLALENNINVLVEKPITLNAQQINELYELADQRNLILIEAVKTMCMNTYLKLKESLELIGQIKHVELNIMREYENYPKDINAELANIYKHELDGGVINDLASYVLYPLVDLIDDEYTISTEVIKEDYLDVITEVHAKLIGKNVVGEINLSMKNQGKNISIISGTKGYMTIDSMTQFNEVIVYEYPEKPIKKIQKEHEHLMESEIKHMNDLIILKQTKSNIYTAKLALNVQKLMQRMNECSEKK